MAGDLATDKFWVTKNLYHDAEKKYHENLAKLLKKGQRGPEIGGSSDLANIKKIRQNKTLSQKNFAEAMKKEFYKSEAQGTLNKNFELDTKNCVSFEILKDEPDLLKNNLIIPGKFSIGNISNSIKPLNFFMALHILSRCKYKMCFYLS